MQQKIEKLTFFKILIVSPGGQGNYVRYTIHP